MFPRNARLEGYDPELAAAIASENRRQEDHVELIASENYCSALVMEAQGSQLTNKYAKAIRANAITVAANTWISPRNWRSTA